MPLRRTDAPGYDAAMRVRLRQLIERFVTHSDAAMSGELRRAALRHGSRTVGVERDGGELPEQMRVYADKVGLRAHTVTDEDVAALRAAGDSEAEIYELTVGVALGASLARYELGLRALGEG